MVCLGTFVPEAMLAPAAWMRNALPHVSKLHLREICWRAYVMSSKTKYRPSLHALIPQIRGLTEKFQIIRPITM